MNTKECISQSREASAGKLDRVMESKQFDRIVEAILAGKYSWACVLILRFAGYNPLHYIPYRTYNRLIKNNSQRQTLNRLQRQSDRDRAQKSLDRSSYKVNDLSYLDVVCSEESTIKGGERIYLLTDWDRAENNFDESFTMTFLPQT